MSDNVNIIPAFKFTNKFSRQVSGLQVNFVQFRCCWDWGTCPLYGIIGVSTFQGGLIVHKHMLMHSGSNKLSAIL